MAKSKYRGKYPTRIKATSSTTTDGVYCVQTNDGTSYFVSVAACLNAGYTNGLGQLVGLCATTLGHVLQDSVALAAAHQQAQHWLHARKEHLRNALDMRQCLRNTSPLYGPAQHHWYAVGLRESLAMARALSRAARANYAGAQAHYVHMQAVLNAGT